MKANRRTDTRPEIALRSELHRRGLRFRKDFLVALPGARAVRADMAFPRQRLAVFVDGCFWHCCPEHGRVPRANSQYWPAKLARNMRRDHEVNTKLESLGWQALRVWEHVTALDAADMVTDRLGTA